MAIYTPLYGYLCSCYLSHLKHPFTTYYCAVYLANVTTHATGCRAAPLFRSWCSFRSLCCPLSVVRRCVSNSSVFVAVFWPVAVRVPAVV